MTGMNDFDFWLDTWEVMNKRKKVKSLYDDPERNKEAEWEEFYGTSGWGKKYCDGRVMVDHFKTTFPSGQEVKGLNVRAYDPERDEWSIVWLDNRSPPDFEPLVGKFSNGVGIFNSKITTKDGRELLVKFTIKRPSDTTIHWEQAFSSDNGNTWEVNWIMESKRMNNSSVAHKPL